MVRILLKRVGKVKANLLNADIARISQIALSAHAQKTPSIEIYSRKELSAQKKNASIMDIKNGSAHTY